MTAPRVLVVACGALVRELRAVLAPLAESGSVGIDVEYLPANHHNRPERIAAAVRAVVEPRRGDYDRVLVGYADCGTGGALDALADELDLVRLPGAHCYEVFAGGDRFAALHDAEPGTFYLTDFLARYFDALVIAGLGLDTHPELRAMYFGNYRRLCYLAQSDDAELLARARRAAACLELEFHHVPTGLSMLAREVAVSLTELGRSASLARSPVATGGRS